MYGSFDAWTGYPAQIGRYIGQPARRRHLDDEADVLRERRDNTPLLVEHFLAKFRHAPNSIPTSISPTAAHACR